MWKRIALIFTLLLVVPNFIWAQGFTLASNKKHQKIRFELINNLIIIPVEINGVELTFILDSGVSKPILFNLSQSD
jgi:hypothetical protein